jgi:hypothetical protein
MRSGRDLGGFTGYRSTLAPIKGRAKNGGIMDISTLLIAAALITFRAVVLGHKTEGPPVTPLGFPIIEGWEVWYDEWAHGPGAACTWPPKTRYESWVHNPGAYCHWPMKKHQCLYCGAANDEGGRCGCCHVIPVSSELAKSPAPPETSGA